MFLIDTFFLARALETCRLALAFDETSEVAMITDWHEAVEFCEALLEDIDDLPAKADDFVESVRPKVEGIRDWVTDMRHVTEKQITALENIQKGVDKWLRR